MWENPWNYCIRLHPFSVDRAFDPHWLKLCQLWIFQRILARRHWLNANSPKIMMVNSSKRDDGKIWYINMLHKMSSHPWITACKLQCSNWRLFMWWDFLIIFPASSQPLKPWNSVPILHVRTPLGFKSNISDIFDVPASRSSFRWFEA